MKLYGYWRSSAAYRVRIALNLKGLDYETVSVNLAPAVREHRGAAFRAVNPQARIPVLVDGELTLSQSLAILEYLEDKYPEPPILPANREARAFARQLALTIACDVHPLQNSGVLLYLAELGLVEPQRVRWCRHWIAEGLTTFEKLLADGGASGPYCLGGDVTIADMCLVPQIYNARRFEVPLDDWPTLRVVEENCLKLEAFDRARPERQPDAP
ncbi:MAG: maleylacetoacetate isomerase [Gammaproteobacteria bacterium]|nr:maleylacetoacetate isomerase [Gammaproteobacteria bacterium]